MKTCQITLQAIPDELAILIGGIHPSLQEYIIRQYPTINENDFISIFSLKEIRVSFLQSLLDNEQKEIHALTKKHEKKIIKDDSTEKKKQQATDYTLGEKIADRVATFGGSWTFIILFFSFIIGWMIINSLLLYKQSFDPFPYILLNLILSCLAAIQAPIIMMSQNRQEEKDRIRAAYDYEINIKAEHEVDILNKKIDHLLINQHKQIIEVQAIFNDAIETMLQKLLAQKNTHP